MLFVLVSATVLFSIAACARPAAAPVASERAGVVILVQTAQHLDVALATARELLATNEATDVRVLACGQAVGALGADAAAANAIASRGHERVHVVACGISLERAGIAPSALAPGVEVVPNAIVEALRLQRAGFRSVEL